MKILLDTCVWGGVVQELRAAGHDVVWAGDWQEDPGDDEILERSHREGRVLVTLDKDFGELAIVHERPHSGIIRERRVTVAESCGKITGVLVLAVTGEGFLLENVAVDPNPKFGFAPASRYGLKSQWEGIPDDVFMVKFLNNERLGMIEGVVRYRKEFEAAV